MRDGEAGWTADTGKAITHARVIVQATDLPVSADLEKGFGEGPEAVAETVRAAAAAGAGLVGCTIEDATGEAGRPLCEFSLAVERIAAGVEAARGLPFPFVVTARSHNLLYPDARIEETMWRLQAFEEVGADVLFAPGLADIEAVGTVCGAIGKPFHFMVGIKGKSLPLKELEAAGVRRVSLVTSLYRAAMTGFLDAVREIQEKGEFGFVERSATTAELNQLTGI